MARGDSHIPHTHATPTTPSLTLLHCTVVMVSFRVACVAMAAVVVLAWGWLPLVEVEAGGDARFGIVLDAGSSGTRVYLFTWIDGDETATLTEVMHKKVSPGVSHYSENPEEAAKSVEQLLTHARAFLPHSSLHHTAPHGRAHVPWLTVCACDVIVTPFAHQ